jgi:alpha-mannosidase
VVETDRPGLVIETVKPAENDDGLIMRYYDAHNTRGVATLRFARAVVAAEETNMLEEPLCPATWHGREIDMVVRPYGIGTLRIRLAQ